MDIDLNLLKCFDAVAAKRSISLASPVLHLSQPAISLQIKRLEEQVGRRLFDRHPRGLTLTAFGVRYLEKSRELLGIQKELTNLTGETDHDPAGTVRIGTYTTASSYLLADAAAEFLAAYPATSISFAYGESRRLLEKLGNLELDCAVLTDVPENKSLRIEPFFQDELVFAAAPSAVPSSVTIKREKIEPRDLRNFALLSYPLRYDLCYRTVEARLGSHLSKCHVVAESESFDTLKQLLLRGVGATFIPRYLIANDLRSGALKALQVGKIGLPFSVSFVTKRNVELAPAVRRFREITLSVFGKKK